MKLHLPGLTPATHTPFDSNGEVNLNVIEKQAEFLAGKGIGSVFVVGSTGESHSLTFDERIAVAGQWLKVTAGTSMKVVVHVGANCLKDAQRLAAHAGHHGAVAVAALAPSHFKSASLDELLAWTKSIAAACPDTPFYFYDIPSLTGSSFSMSAYMEKAVLQIPSLVGLKFTNADLISFQRVVQQYPSHDILFGIDECLLPALSLGCQGAVGSTYNFAAPLYHKLIAAFHSGDIETARQQQYKSVQLVDLLCSCGGYMPAAKAVMEHLGVPVGAPRQPFPQISQEAKRRLYELVPSLLE
jgi:N-acetylneuraminate lyase